MNGERLSLRLRQRRVDRLTELPEEALTGEIEYEAALSLAARALAALYTLCIPFLT